VATKAKTQREGWVSGRGSRLANGGIKESLGIEVRVGLAQGWQ
jgi:hypothetical protein